MRGEEAFPQEIDLKIQVEQILKDSSYKNGIQNIMSHSGCFPITQHTSIDLNHWPQMLNKTHSINSG